MLNEVSLRVDEAHKSVRGEIASPRTPFSHEYVGVHYAILMSLRSRLMWYTPKGREKPTRGERKTQGEEKKKGLKGIGFVGPRRPHSANSILYVVNRRS